MSAGPDLFVVCKECGSEVSPYITECPYCGHRLRRRAPKLPKEGRSHGKASVPSSLGRLRAGEIPGLRADSPPYVTAALVIASCVVWVVWRGAFVSLDKLVVAGPLQGDWWKLVTAQLTYLNGFYQFAALLAIAVFGWLLERRYGHLVVLALFLAASVAGAFAALALYPDDALVSGANGPALALVCAWAVPDLRAARRHRYYDGDLLGAAACAAALLLMPAARIEASWTSGVVGALIGLVVGLGLDARPTH